MNEGPNEGTSPCAWVPMADVTSLLHAVGPADPAAAAELLPLVYDEVRRLEAHRLAHEALGQTLQPTALPSQDQTGLRTNLTGVISVW